MLKVETAVEHTPINPTLHNPVSFTACVTHADTDTSLAIKGALPAVLMYSSSERVLNVPAGRYASHTILVWYLYSVYLQGSMLSILY